MIIQTWAACSLALLIRTVNCSVSDCSSLSTKWSINLGFIRPVILKSTRLMHFKVPKCRIETIVAGRSTLKQGITALRLSNDIPLRRTLHSSYDDSLFLTRVDDPGPKNIGPFNQLPSEVFSFAPLMKHTHRHWRYFFRLLTKQSWVYTEMTSADYVVDRDDTYRTYALSFSPEEHPIALQLGGANPTKLAAAARIAVRDFGYDAINLNCGCPSPAVSGVHAAGAAHMMDPVHAARCCAAMSSAVPDTPITVKCRTGVAFAPDFAGAGRGAADTREIRCYDGLQAFVRSVAEDGGVRRFVVHARAALLGAGTIDNRLVPPLNRPDVARLAADFPALDFVLNGAIADPTEAARLLADGAERAAGQQGRGAIAGVMVGRAVVNHPWAWASLDPLVHGLPAPPPTAATRAAALAAYIEYAAAQADARSVSGCRIGGDVDFHRDLAAPVFNLLAGEPCAAVWRRSLSRMIARGSPAHRAIWAAMTAVPREVLEAPAGAALGALPLYSGAPPSVGQLRPTIT